MKAIFSSRQDIVKTTTIGGRTTVQICLNEERKDIENQETGEVETGYSYDYNEWSAENVDIDAVKANPSKYIDYAPSPEPTKEDKIEQRISDLEDMLADAVGGAQ